MKIFLLLLLLAFTIQAMAIPAAHITVKINLADKMLYVAREGSPIFSAPIENVKSNIRGTYYVTGKDVFYFNEDTQIDFPYCLQLKETTNGTTSSIHYFPSDLTYMCQDSVCIHDLKIAKQIYDLVPSGSLVSIE
jgi:hypothetical protein